MRLLIYGAGVIGCLYASLFCEAGYDTTIYARGKRLESLKKYGLCYIKNRKRMKAAPRIIENVTNEDTYDFIFLTVRENQVHQALKELRNNNSPNIVTMVNTIEPYSDWEEMCGKGRIMPAFPGAGGSFDGNILKADLTHRLIQPTTFAEINGKETERIMTLSAIFRQSHIPYQIIRDMHDWQICHLAMVVPIADAYYEADDPKKAGKEKSLMCRTAKRMKRNYITLHNLGIVISPKKMNVFRFIPIAFLRIGLRACLKNAFCELCFTLGGEFIPNL